MTENKPGLQPGAEIAFVVAGTRRHATVAEVLHDGKRLAIFKTATGAIVLRRASRAACLDPFALAMNPDTWQLAPTPEAAAALLDPADPDDHAALVALGWVRLGAVEA